jgi:hypothetical protein
LKSIPSGFPTIPLRRFISATYSLLSSFLVYVPSYCNIAQTQRHFTYSVYVYCNFMFLSVS